MPLVALGFLLLAAALHATWNLFVKRAQEKQVMIWWALVVGVICYVPVIIVSTGVSLAAIWPFLLSSACVEALYYFLLIRAYQYGDFSLVYPIARGTAPALLLLWTLLFLGERPTLAGLIGIGLLVIGLMIVGGRAWWSLRKTTKLSTSGLGMALGTALCISVYTTIDGAAVRHTNPLPYTVIVIALTALMITPLILVRYGKAAIIAEWRANWLRIALTGIFTLLAYILALTAYTMTRVSYAGAIREISVVFGAFLGWRILNEEFGYVRLAGSICIFGGILVIALAG